MNPKIKLIREREAVALNGNATPQEVEIALLTAYCEELRLDLKEKTETLEHYLLRHKEWNTERMNLNDQLSRLLQSYGEVCVENAKLSFGITVEGTMKAAP